MEQSDELSKSIIADQESIDLRRYALIAWHHRWMALIIVVMAMVIAFLVYTGSPKVYKGTAEIYYNREEVINVDIQTGSHYVKPDKEFWLRTMKGLRTYHMLKELSGLPQSPQQLRGYFAISTERDQDIFLVDITTRDGRLIPELSQGLVDALNEVDRNNIANSYASKLDYLNRQLTKKKAELEEVEAAIEVVGGSLNISNVDNIDQLKKTHDSFKEQMKNAEVELDYVQAAKESTQNEMLFLNDTLFEQASFTEPLKVQLMNLYVDLARSLTKYGDEHPVVKGIRKNITHVEQMLQQGFEQNVEIKNIKSNPIKRGLMADYTDLKIKEISLQAKIESLQQKVDGFEMQVNSDAIGSNLFHLLKKREPLMRIIDILNEKIIETEMAKQDVGDSFKLISKPSAPASPSNKNIFFFLLVGLFAGLLLAAGLIVVYDFLDNRIKLVSDVENFFSFPVIGSLRRVNTLHKSNIEELYDHQEAHKLFENELTEIRINMNQLVKRKERKLFAVVSPARKDGKSLICYLMALAFAQNGKKILIIDYDTMIPRLTKIFDMKKHSGLQDFLLYDADYNDVVHPTGVENLDLIPCGQNKQDLKLRYNSEQAEDLLHRVILDYDMVIIDTPALNPHPHIFDLLKYLDHVIIATRLHKTSRRDVEAVSKKLSHIETQLKGTIITDTRMIPFGSYYESYARYNYYYDYSSNNKEE